MGYIDKRWGVSGHTETQTPNGVAYHGTLTIRFGKSLAKEFAVATYSNDGNGGCCRWRASETYGHRFAEFQFEAKHFRNYREAIGYAVNHEHTDHYLLLLLEERLSEKDSKAA